MARLSSIIWAFMALTGLTSAVSSSASHTSSAVPSSTPTPSSASSRLNITALTAANNQSILECWALTPGFTVSNTPGTKGVESLGIGAAGNSSSVSLLPAQFDGGLHNAPAPQWVIFLSGLAVISLPHANDTAYVVGGSGQQGIIFAADTANVSGDGHRTVYPSNEVTVALQLPVADGKVPQHVRLHGGACTPAEQAGN